MFLEYPNLAFLVFSLTFVIVLHFLILDEEKYLLEQHGDTYKKYRDSVKRYLSL
jgi:protein-S-isoprenylcysteine O-methyltransferase Ste14